MGMKNIGELFAQLTCDFWQVAILVTQPAFYLVECKHKYIV